MSTTRFSPAISSSPTAARSLRRVDTIVYQQCPQSIVVCACAIALRDLVTETSADAEHLRQALSGVGCLALLHRHEHGIPTHPHGLAVRPVRRRARPGQPRCRTMLPSPASRARAALPGAAAALGRAHAPFGRAARRTHRAQRPARRHNHRRAGASPDAPLLGRLLAP